MMLCVDPLDSSADSPLTIQAEDAAALLRLYLNFDLLEAAAELVLEYVDALLGRGHQYFGIEVGLVFTSQHALFQLVPLNRLFQRPLSATSSSVWLPYTSIDQLLQALSETQTNASVSLPQSVTSSESSSLTFSVFQTYNRLRDKLDDYHRLVEKTTQLRLVAR